jgi:hypothetical protein
MEPEPFAGAFSVGDVLWSSRGGLLATSPAIYLSVIGLAALWRVDRLLGAVAVAVFALTTLVVSAQASWWESAWPAPAPFVAITPYFVCGAAALVDVLGRAVARHATVAAAALLTPLVIWNLTLMQVAADAAFELGDPVSFGRLGAAQAGALHRWIGHPPSMPGNLAFGLANRVHPARYDVLAASQLLAGGATEGEIDIGEGDTTFVGAGWHGAERAGERTFRWATASATLQVPLDHPADIAVGLDVSPYRPPGRPAQQLTIVVNGAAQEPVTLGDGWHRAAFGVPASAWRSGVNHVELRFAYDARPGDAGIPDGRLLAAAVDTLLVRTQP